MFYICPGIRPALLATCATLYLETVLAVMEL